jgi:environmental stress-induced protein Ves
VRILRAADHRAMPWKNGGGETLEIAISPAGASVSDFDWRLSMAKVLGSGPFSVFSGTDRTLAVVAGELTLAVAGRPAVQLTSETPAYQFPGDVAARAEVTHAVTDLNVMVRRGAFSAEVHKLDGANVAGCDGETFVLIRSSARLRDGQELGCNDVIVLAPSETMVFDRVPAAGWVIEIRAR